MRLTMYSFLTSIVIKMEKKNMIGMARTELEACSQIGRSTLTQHAHASQIFRRAGISCLDFIALYTTSARAFY